jgi:hypothetical protein
VPSACTASARSNVGSIASALNGRIEQLLGLVFLALDDALPDGVRT